MGTQRRPSVNTRAACLLALTLIALASADNCKSGCRGTHSLFKYEVGHTYQYTLDGVVTVLVASTDSQETALKIRGNVLLSQLPDCNQLLQLQNVLVLGPDGKKHGSLEDITKPVRFNFNDGLVDPEICAESDDSQNSLNIKRAIISLFQSATKRGSETDVFGTCPTQFTFNKDDGSTTVTKIRNLNQCAHRESLKQGFLNTLMNPNSGIKSSPLLSGDLVAEQRVKDGILEHVSLAEDYNYRPFSNGQAGAKAKAVTRLSLVSHSAAAPPASKASQSRSIIFESPHLVSIAASNVNNLLSTLKNTVKSLEESVGSRSARLFADLIKVLRVTKKDDLLAVYGQVKAGAGVKDKALAKKVFFDALFRAGTGDSVEVSVELLRNHELSPFEQKLVYISLAHVQHASAESLNTAANLLEQANVPREAYLGVGTLAARYCRQHSCTGSEVKKITDAFVKKLSDCTVKERAQQDVVVAALKGLKNTQHLQGAGIDKVVACFENKKAPARVRVAALEAAHSASCDPKIQKEALDLLQDNQEDSELRIQAYLVLVQCPSGSLANSLKSLLDTETVNQVGSFIDSHLRNIRASTNPDLENARQHLGLVRSSKRFPIDIRRFSYNRELSYSVDALGLGASVDNTVIYYQKCFLPRSASLNLTGEVFGHQFNLLEVGARQENLDRLVEHYIGPKGVLTTASPQDLYDKARKAFESLKQQTSQRFEQTRGRRSFRQEIDAFASKVSQDDVDSDLELDLALKVFGTELVFLSLGDDARQLTPSGLLNKLFDGLDKGLNKAKQFDHDVSSQVLFLDAELSYPTGAGLPLKLDAFGTAAVHLQAKGSIDVRQILRDPKNASIKLKLVPSANIEISGGLSIDAQVVRTGIQVLGTLHTSTGADVSVTLLENGNGVDVKVGLPIEKQDIFSVSHNIVFTTRERGHASVSTPLRTSSNRKDYSGCFDQLSRYTGLTFCGEVGIPLNSPTGTGAPFPLNGPSKLSLRVDKEDLKEYHFKALYHPKDDKHHSLELLFDTPGSNTKRTIALNVVAALEPSKLLKISIESPIRAASLEVKVTETAQEKTLSARLLNGDEEYSARIGASISGDHARQVYKPLIELKAPGGGPPSQNVEGQIIVERTPTSVKYTFEGVQITLPGQPPYRLDGTVSKISGVYTSDLKVSQDKHYATIQGKLDVVHPNNVKVNGKIHNSVNPDVDFSIDFEHSLNEKDNEVKEVENKLVLIHGRDLNSDTNSLKINQKCQYGGLGTEKMEVSSKNSISYPLLGIKLKLEAAANKKEVSYDLEVAYNKFKISSELEVKRNNKQLGDYDVEFEVKVNDKALKLEAKREIIGVDKSKLSNTLELVPGGKYSVDADVTHRLQPTDVNLSVDAVIRVPNKSQEYKINTRLVRNPQLLDSQAKISAGTTVYIDALLKAVRNGQNVNGDIKIVVKDLLTTKGDIKVADGKGSGTILIDIVKLHRKILGDVTFTVKEPVYNAVVDVLYDFEKDNSKKLLISTSNDVTGNSISSKNVVQAGPYKTELNFNGDRKGSLVDGTIKGHFDTTLPNGHYVSGGFDREISTTGDISKGRITSSLSHAVKKGGKGWNAKLNGVLTNFNKKDKSFQISHTLVLTTPDGKDLIIDESVSHSLEGEKRTGQGQFSIKGSLISKPVDLVVNVGKAKKTVTVKVNGKCGSDSAFDYAQSLTLGDPEGQASNKVSLTVNLPSDKYKVISFVSDVQAKRAKSDADDYELRIKSSGSLNDKTVEVESNLKGNKQHGYGKLAVSLPNEDPFSVEGSFKRDESNDVSKCESGLEVIYGKSKRVKVSTVLVRKPGIDLDLDVKLETPVEHANNVHLQLSHKRSNNDKTLATDLQLTADGQHYGLTSGLELSETSPSAKVVIVYPNGKSSKFFAKFERLGEKKFKGEAQIESIHDFSLVASGEANIENVDNFVIKIDVDSARLNLNKVHIEVHSKPDKAGKRLDFSAKSANKNIVSGSTTYNTKEELGKVIIEGSGSVTVREEKRSANFKYIRNNLNQEVDGERGVHITVNAAFGQQVVLGELKLTNKEFHLLESYCEEKKQCAHLEISSKLNSIDLTGLNHELEIGVDLRKLGLSHEFGLKATTVRQGFTLDHTVDIHFQSQDKAKYQYSVYLHPKKAGVVLTLPKRVVAIEGTLELPKGKTLGPFGPFNAELSVYLNKNNEPAQKSNIVIFVDGSHSNKQFSSNGLIKFSHPAIKDLVISGKAQYNAEKHAGDFNVDIDVFAKKNQKIVVTGKLHTAVLPTKGYNVTSELLVSSVGQNFEVSGKAHIAVASNELSFGSFGQYRLDKQQRETGLLLSANPRHFELLVRGPHHDVIHVDANLQLSKESQSFDSKVHVLGAQPLVAQLEIKNLNTFKLTASKQDTPQNKLVVSGGAVFGQVAEIKADAVKDGATNNLFFVTVHLDESNFLKSDFGASADQIKHVLERTRDELTASLGKVRSIAENSAKEVHKDVIQYSETLKGSVPNFKELAQAYNTQLEQLKEELLADKTIKEISELLNRIFGATARTLSEVLVSLTKLFEKLSTLLTDAYTQVLEIVKNKILPQLRESYSKIVAVIIDLSQSALNLVTHYLVKLSDVLKAHQDDLKKIATMASDLIQDISGIIIRAVAQLRNEIKDFATLIYDQIKALPLLSGLREKYQEIVGDYAVPEHVFSVLSEAVSAVRDTLPTPELRDFVDAAHTYIQKKLKHEPTDDIAELRKLHALLAKAVKSVVELVRAQASGDAHAGLLRLVSPISFDGLRKLPQLATLRLSALNLLRTEDLPSIIAEVLLELRPKSLNPIEMLPPFKSRAFVADGQHIFTFDKRHLTFPGSCNYVLAQDIVDGNFTIVANLDNGVLKSISLTDKSDSVEIGLNGAVKLNGVNSELPVHQKDLHAWRKYHTVNLFTKYGVLVACSNDLRLCSFEVSGFYLGKTRGLLGNGNGEPFDDFVLPSGKISSSESEFGNAYKLTPSCPDVKTVDHSHHGHHGHAQQNAVCDSLFASDSSLRPCFALLAPTPFRQACEHASASSKDKEDSGCNIALIYTAACRLDLVPISAPAQCGKCDTTGKKVSVGEFFSVSVPLKEKPQADIVFLVETDQSNNPLIKDLVVPLLNQIVSDLKAHGISDTQTAVIGFNDKQSWPAHYTSNGKLNFRGKAEQIKSFADVSEKPVLVTGDDKIDNAITKAAKLLEVVKAEIGLSSISSANVEALDYPFRAGATKTIIGISSKAPNKYVSGLPALRVFLFSNYAKHTGVQTHLIAPVDDLSLSGAKDKARNIVGFNRNTVFSLSDGKKKVEGSPDLRANLHYAPHPSLNWALGVNGNVYASQNFLALKGKQRNQFVSVVTSTIVDQITRTEVQSDCVCRYKNGLFPETLCRATDRNVLPVASRRGAARG